MPDLGAYAAEVLTAYAITAALLIGIVALTLWRGVRVKRALARAERRSNG